MLLCKYFPIRFFFYMSEVKNANYIYPTAKQEQHLMVHLDIEIITHQDIMQRIF